MEDTTETAQLRQPKDDGVPRKCSGTKRYSEVLRDFDNLELSFVSMSVDELLQDPDTLSLSETADITLDDLTNEEEDNTAVCQDGEPSGEEKEGSMSAQDADLAMCRSESGVELALQYAKMWCRYAKDLLTWLDKRISLEQEYAKNITKAAETAKSCVTQQDMMPLQYIYTMAMEQDIKTSATAKHTTELLHQRCYQALSAKRNEIDKWRREFKEQWAKEQKRMNDAVAALKRARQQYLQRCEELEKAKAISAKGLEEAGGSKTLDKRRKSRDDAQTKVADAEALYRQCVFDANAHQDELEKVKEKIIVHIRKLICQGDTVLKEVTVNMFYYQRQQTEAVPLGYHNLELTCRPCEPGDPFLHYVFKKCRHEQPLQTFAFQEFIPQSKRSPSTGRRKTSNPLAALQDPLALTDETRRGSSVSDGRRIGYSDSESMGGSLESLSSPAHGNRKLPKAPSTGTMSSDDLDEKDINAEAECGDPLNDSNGSFCKVRTASRAALTHRLRKMKSKMVKCKQCENFILVNGIECEECGLAVHRKCLELCQTECDHRRGNLFGVEFSLLPREQPQDVPFIVQRCTGEIESRALTVQGVYRVSGSKPRILKLCHAFETQKDQVDLAEVSPHDVTSVLKYFFKELPEPLLTFDLYNDFINIGKEIQRLSEKDHVAETAQIVENIVINIKQLLARLPPCNYSTVRHMMGHLHRISENFEENKMSPGNLGIVFGPTLLRPLVSGDVSMIALLESSYQAMLVEFMITNHDQIFGPAPRACTPPPPVPTAPLPETPPRASCPAAQEGSDSLDGSGASTRERPRSLERRTLKRDLSEGYISDKSSSSEAVDQLSADASERAVLAMRSAMTAPRGHSEGVIDPHSGTQMRGHFSRQPVKPQRHAAPCLRSKTPEHILRSTSPSSITGHSPLPHSLPCEPERGTRFNASAALLSNARTEKAGPPLYQNNNQSNHGLTRSLRRHPAEERTAQKILSGLKLRRSNSRKGEQLHFV
ncbi:GEM-interacting protein isoform X1 [Astyanax mexicanus]|uniref:GEM-interacting protein isoform X1 n=1 Tax=Astyanax mexicanus TaxID=7994 RepID=UPI0020CAD57F|nr:GEM-interacting protein isoform X1 [Astyanax mexicanus]